MRSLAIYRHYWPDATPYARLLRSILEHVAERGHSATVYTAQPSYNDVRQPRQPWRETLNSVAIRRLPLLPERKRSWALRLLNTILFLSGAVLHAVRHRRRYDIILANAHPPVLMGLALRLTRLLAGIPYVLNLQDIHPESAILARRLRNGRFAHWLRRLDAWGCGNASCLVTLSEDMRKTLHARNGGLPATRIEVINNCPLDRYESVDQPVDPQPDAPRPFRVLFAGNMGMFQQLDRLIDVARELQDRSDIEFRFMGAGVAKKSLIEQAGALTGRNVHFDPHQPVETAFACMQQSDLGVVSLAAGVYRVAYPSKTMMYLAAGCPVLVLVEPESCLAKTIRSNDLGFVPVQLRVRSIAETILMAAVQRHRWDRAARDELRLRAEELFGRDQMLARWERIFGESHS